MLPTLRWSRLTIPLSRASQLASLLVAVVVASPFLIAFSSYISELPGTLTALMTRMSVLGIG